MKRLLMTFLMIFILFTVSCGEDGGDTGDTGNTGNTGNTGDTGDTAGNTGCVADCTGKECGDDGCGGSCGSCESGYKCGDDNMCYNPCSGKECGESEGIQCGKCESGYYCNASNVCEYFIDAIEMVLVSSGTTASDNGSITVDHDFYMGKYEVTFEEWDQYVAATGAESPDDEGWDRGTRPVINVSWYEAIKYANWLSEQAGLEKVYDEICYIDTNSCIMDTTKKGYRLPTEDEWEYAARGGKDGNATTYSGSDTIDDVAWYSGNSGDKTHEVGTKQANELGIYDMSGNVWEWSFDDYKNSGRVFRGGSWRYNADFCEVSYRNNYAPASRGYSLGVRLSRTK